MTKNREPNARRFYNGNFTIIGNDVFSDDRLSLEEIGLLSYLRSKPDDWIVIFSYLQKRFDIGRDKLRRIMDGLVERGYITRTRSRDDSGAFGPYEYQIFDIPKLSSPDTENPHWSSANDDSQCGKTGAGSAGAVNPSPVNPQLLNTESTNTDSKKDIDLLAGLEPSPEVQSEAADWPKDFREQFWSRYPVRKGKQSAIAKLESIRARRKIAWADIVRGLDNLDAAIADGRQDPAFVKHPTTWLNGGCWDDEYKRRGPSKPPNGPSNSGPGTGPRGRVTASDIMREGREWLEREGFYDGRE